MEIFQIFAIGNAILGVGNFGATHCFATATGSIYCEWTVDLNKNAPVEKKIIQPRVSEDFLSPAIETCHENPPQTRKSRPEVIGIIAQSARCISHIRPERIMRNTVQLGNMEPVNAPAAWTTFEMAVCIRPLWKNALLPSKLWKSSPESISTIFYSYQKRHCDC